jgi:AraC family transcriptional regulator, ethanolamine operon transcriptional activator
MSKMPNPATPPSVEALETGHQNLAQAGFQLIDQDLVRLQSAPLKARQVIIRLEGSVLKYDGALTPPMPL